MHGRVIRMADHDLFMRLLGCLVVI